MQAVAATLRGKISASDEFGRWISRERILLANQITGLKTKGYFRTNEIDVITGANTLSGKFTREM